MILGPAADWCNERPAHIVVTDMGSAAGLWEAMAGRSRAPDQRGPEAKGCKRRERMPSPDRREAVFQRHDFTCVYCGERFTADELTVDHVEPRVKGGDHSKGNLVAACWPCNREKGGQPAWAYLSDRPDKRANFLRHARWVWPRLRAAVAEAAGPTD